MGSSDCPFNFSDVHRLIWCKSFTISGGNNNEKCVMWLTPDLRDHLVYWRNPLESGVVFGSVLTFLVAIQYVSLISVVGNLFLALVTSTVTFRLYKSVLTALNKTQDKSHPFQVGSKGAKKNPSLFYIFFIKTVKSPSRRYLDADVELPLERVLALTEDSVNFFNGIITKLKNIYLVENFLESLKFAAAMYLLTFVGRLVNMVTLLIMAWVVAFSWPRIYQDNQTKIDEALAPIKVKVEELTSKLPQLTAAKKED